MASSAARTPRARSVASASIALALAVALLSGRGAAPPASAPAVWAEALQAERARSQLLLSKFQDLELRGPAPEAEALRGTLEEASAADEASAEASAEEFFQRLRVSNDELEEALQAIQSGRKSSLPSIPIATVGDPVNIDILPPVRDTDGPALIPGAPHVRVSLPLSDNSEVMWGCDLTPLYDPSGGRLLCFTAFLPLGLRLGPLQRPKDVPPSEHDLIGVEAVDAKGEADTLGILPGDVLRAVSYVGLGPEPGWLDSMLGAEAMPMKKVMKCDGRSLEEVTEALLSNRDSPDGRLVLLLERPS